MWYLSSTSITFYLLIMSQISRVPWAVSFNRAFHRWTAMNVDDTWFIRAIKIKKLQLEGKFKNGSKRPLFAFEDNPRCDHWTDHFGETTNMRLKLGILCYIRLLWLNRYIIKVLSEVALSGECRYFWNGMHTIWRNSVTKAPTFHDMNARPLTCHLKQH